MNDLIDRQMAIDAVEESRRLNHHQNAKEACCHEYEHRHFLKILMDLQPAQQWIPCSERLPDVDEELESADVYITYKNTYWTGVTTTNVAIARYGEKLLSSDGKYLDTPGWVGNKKYSVDDVLAWMPLPEPYTER